MERFMMVVTESPNNNIITRAFVKSEDEIEGICLDHYKYYKSRGLIAKDFDEWKKNLEYRRE